MATIPTHDLPTIQGRVDRINRRAEKLGLEGVTLEVGPETTRTELGEDGLTERVYHEVEVEVVGPTVMLAGWTFLASIDHNEGLVATAPHVEADGFRAYVEEARCDHCHTNRDRSRTYVLEHEDGSRVQVGSTCINDFLGHKVSLWVMEAAGTLDDDLESWGSGEGNLGLESYLTVVAGVIRSYGWVSRSKARESFDLTSTADDAMQYIATHRSDVREAIVPGAATDKDTEVARAAIEWALSIEADNDYLYNLQTVAGNGYVTHRSMGIAASMVAAYRRTLEQEAERQAEQENSEPVPVTEDRIVVTGTITKLDARENAYGTRYVMVVKDRRGFALWGTQPSKLSTARLGDVVTFTARVERSDRDDYFGFFSRPTKVAFIEQQEAA